MTTIFFVFRYVLAWLAPLFAFLALTAALSPWGGDPPALAWFIAMLVLLFVMAMAFSHVRRVRLIAGRVDRQTLANRHRRQIEVPFGPEETFDLLDGAVRELPRSWWVESARDSLQVSARVRGGLDAAMARLEDEARRTHRRESGPDGAKSHSTEVTIEAAFALLGGFRMRRNRIFATVTPGDGTSSITLVCEPEAGAWADWFTMDHGTNLENAEAISRAISRRVGERRRLERASGERTAAEKELAVAKLSLLNAQVEPHFLYNTLASAQYLARTDPPRADQMLGHLIQYLRRSLPTTDGAPSTLGDELDRARAYLEILKIRMGSRLDVRIDVPDDLLATSLPPMMLQPLVENAIKHGLEPKPGDGTVWIRAQRHGAQVAITVADDGMGFGTQSGGTGIGLTNVRERLKLVYGDAATLTVAANFPHGVAATLGVPAQEAAHGR